MATACYISIYDSYSDRGAFVQKAPRQQREIDENEIKVGEMLPWWDFYSGPIVKGYDGAQLDLEYEGKTFHIKVGEEVLIDESILSQEYGVTHFSLKTVKVISTEFIYQGGWQFKDTILQKLEGPIGEGEVLRPNGDYFKGYFHLSYASIGRSVDAGIAEVEITFEVITIGSQHLTLADRPFQFLQNGILELPSALIDKLRGDDLHRFL